MDLRDIMYPFKENKNAINLLYHDFYYIENKCNGNFFAEEREGWSMMKREW